MERWHSKILAMIGTFIIPFFTTMLPWKVSEMFAKKGKKGKEILGCLMCFGGGVFFATYILHMGPEVTFILKTALLKPNHIDYPLSEFIMAVGFFMVLYIEKFAISAYGRHKLWKRNKKTKNTQEDGETDIEQGNDMDNDIKYKVGYHSGDSNNVGTVIVTESSETGKLVPGVNGCVCAHGARLNGQVAIEVVKLQEPEEEDIHSTRSLVLMLALSLHRIFEGMSVGLKYSVTGVWNLFVAVMCHEAVIGFSLGLQFVKNNLSLRRFVITTLMCSIIMPVGVGIGTLIIEKGEPSTTLDIVNGVLQAISTGTFIYVTFFEILNEELDHHNSTQAKLASVVVGFGLMAALSAIPEPPEVLPLVNLVNMTAISEDPFTTVLP